MRSSYSSPVKPVWTIRFIEWVLTALLLCENSSARLVSETVTCCHGRSTIRYHYDDVTNSNDNTCHDTFVVIGVGTAMETEQYDGVAGSMVLATTKDVIVFVLDAEPHMPIKLSPKAFARAVDALLQELLSSSLRLPGVKICAATDSLTRKKPTVVVGGHSASGAAAWYAVQNEYFTQQSMISGYVGLDPFSMKEKQVETTLRTASSRTRRGQARRTTRDTPLRAQLLDNSSSTKTAKPNPSPPLPIPSVYWGFQETTCSVSIEHAAWAAYNQTQAHRRAMYQLQASSNFSHCCFADHGCMPHICSCTVANTAAMVLHRDVGRSVQALLRHIQSGRHDFVPGQFQGSNFELDPISYKIFLDAPDYTRTNESMVVQ